MATLLIVEDDGILAADLEDILTRLDYSLLGPVATGEEAITILNSHQVDLVLMDIELAGKLSGIQTAEILSRSTDIPIVFLTGFSHETLLEQAKVVAPYGYLIKPVLERELTATIMMSLHRHRLDRELKESRIALEKSEAQYHLLMEATLKEKEMHYREVVQNVSSAIIRCKNDGTVCFANDYALTFFGYRKDEIIGRHMSILLPQKDSSGTDLSSLFQNIMTLPERYKNNENENVCRDGRRVWMTWTNKPILDDNGQVVEVLSVGNDITANKQTEAYREMGREILQVLNDPRVLAESFQHVVDVLMKRTGFDAVGIRLQEGEDFPYVAQRGFSREFLLTENSLLERATAGGLCRDQDGNVRLECTCGLVISGKTDPTSPLFTPGGSFWVNDSEPLLDIPSSEDPRLHPRNQCIHLGYASVALAPIRDKEKIVGLIQFNDRRKGCFTLDSIEILEMIASQIGTAMVRKQAEAALKESEIKYRALFENMTNGFALQQIVVDDAGKPIDFIFREVNSAFEKHTGMKSVDILNKKVTQVLPGIEKDPADWIGIYGKVALTGTELRFEQFSEPLGRWYSVVAFRPMQCFFATVFEDITEKRRAEEVQSSLAAIVASAEDAIISNDLQGIIQTWNVGAENIFGYTAEEVIGKNISLLVPLGHVNGNYDILKLVSRGEQVENYECDRKRKDGTIIPVSVTVSAIKNANGKVIGASRIAHDITKRQHAEQLQVLNDDLELRVERRTRELQETQKQFLHAEKLSAIGKLSASIAHEFNNPLQGIMTILKGLKKRAVLQEMDKKMLYAAISESERIKSLILNLQEFNRPSSGRKGMVDVNKSLDSLLLLNKSDFNGRRISVVLDYEEGLPQILAVSDQLKQVFLNLLINAADACHPPGGVITVHTWQEDEKVAVAIKDTGIGIQPSDMELIFQPFFTTKPEVKGTGLGLSASYGIVQQHQGEIRVNSQPGEGATFTVVLPIKGADDIVPAIDR